MNVESSSRARHLNRIVTREAVTGTGALAFCFARSADVAELQALAETSNVKPLPLVDPDGVPYFLLGHSDLNAETDTLEQ